MEIHRVTKYTKVFRTLGRPEEGMSKDTSMDGKKKNKEKILRDITNQLVSRPIKLKPTWTGPKLQTRSIFKETKKQKGGCTDNPRDQSGPMHLHFFSFGPPNLLGPEEIWSNGSRPLDPYSNNLITKENELEDSMAESF